MARAKKQLLTIPDWGNRLTLRAEVGTSLPTPLPRDGEPSPMSTAVEEARGDTFCVMRNWDVKSLSKNHDRQSEGSLVTTDEDEFNGTPETIALARHGEGSCFVCGGSYGWGKTDRCHLERSMFSGFFRGLDGYTAPIGTYSYPAGEVSVPHIPAKNIFQAGLDVPMTENVVRYCKRIVFFGSATNVDMQAHPVGANQDQVATRFDDIFEAGVQIISISPLRQELDSKLRACWLQCRPGSDLAVMLALIHTLIDEDLYDKDFIAECCSGFDSFAEYVMGSTDGRPKNAAWAQAESEIPSQEILMLARLMAADRCIIGLPSSTALTEHAERSAWVAIALASALGYIGLPGGGLMMGSGMDQRSVRPERLSYSPGSLLQQETGSSGFIPLGWVIKKLTAPHERLSFNRREYRPPKLDLVCHARSMSHGESAGGCLADSVLPLASLFPRRHLIEPPRDSRDDFNILITLTLGLVLGFFHGRNRPRSVKPLFDLTEKNISGVWLLPTFDDLKAERAWGLRPLPMESNQVFECLSPDPILPPGCYRTAERRRTNRG
jgi:biotin/methionine sulfoxide reductase